MRLRPGGWRLVELVERYAGKEREDEKIGTGTGPFVSHGSLGGWWRVELDRVASRKMRHDGNGRGIDIACGKTSGRGSAEMFQSRIEKQWAGLRGILGEYLVTFYSHRNMGFQVDSGDKK